MRLVSVLVAVASIAALVVAGVTLPVYWVFLLTSVALGALLARSVGLVTGQAGLLMLSQLSFAAIGAWVVWSVGTAFENVPFVLLLVAAAAVAGCVGALLGLVAVRIRGIEFAVVTLGFAAALDLVLRQSSFVGVSSSTPYLPGAPFDQPQWFFALVWALLGFTWLLLRIVQHRRLGGSWELVRSSERMAAGLGVQVGLAKVSAVAISAAIAGAVGALMTAQYGLITPQMFSVLGSLTTVATAVFAGASVLGGALLAGVFTVLMPELLRRFGLPLDLGNLLFVIGAIDVLRRGHGGIAEQLRDRIETRVFRGERVTCDLKAQNVRNTILTPAPPATLADRPALVVQDLTVRAQGTLLLDRVSLSVAEGEVHALVGANGAGKTTLIDAITGFVAAEAHCVQVGGRELTGLGATARARAGIRRTFQTQQLPDGLTVADFIELAQIIRDPERAERARTHFGLPAPRVPIRLTDQATRKLIAVAATVASGASVVLLDEPSAGLGDIDREAICDAYRSLVTEFGVSVLIVEHDLALVRAVADRVTVLDAGRVIASGSPGDALSHPDVVRALMGDAPDATIAQ